jgi:hypothetical protein
VITKYTDFLYEYSLSNKPIADTIKYLEAMKKGLSDKLFFLNKIDLDCLVDFGSADGTLLNYLHKYKPNIKLIGYDIDENMINISRRNYNDIKFESDWNKVIENISTKDYNNTGLLLSSVVHEVYSYGVGKEIKNFWNNQVFNNNFKYVIIRDMIPSTYFEKMNIIDINKIKEKSNKQHLEDFQNKWGDIGENYRILLHWLLKYTYTDNWERELNENYVPLTIETLKTKIPNNWKIIFEEHYVYDFIKQQIKKEFDVELTDPTHLKMIIENKNFND